MNALELYGMTPISISKDIYKLFGSYYNHVPEIVLPHFAKPNEEIEINQHGYYNCRDGRRFWELSSVWFEGAPIMIIQNAGREGDDHAERFITNEYDYTRMVTYIKTLLSNNDENKIESVYSIGEDLGDLNTFYGRTLLLGKETPFDSK